MEFVNTTPFPSVITRGALGERELLASVTCKITFGLNQGWLVPVADEEMWPVFEEPFEFQGLTLNVDTDYRKQKTDLLLFGNARTPKQQPLTQMPIGVQSSKRTLVARWMFGHRFWLKDLFGLKASAPRPFTEMPISNEYAFGGTLSMNGQEVGHMINPVGRGFYFSAEEALNKPLPNLERPDGLVTKWEDRPVPGCLFKPVGPLELAETGQIKPEELAQIMMPTIMQDAVPELRLDPADLGEWLRVIGFDHQGDQFYPTPPLNPGFVRLIMGEKRSRFPLILRSLVLLTDHKVMVATYRADFRYLLQAFTKRTAELHWTAPLPVKPAKPR
ncbi:MAG: DUF2169 domain-containing protein [Bacteroidetes Order II. Incertae sedis bacterium]|nr:DUF2169 domain-containing protein [Bacteroidetes Order II. bacterium]